MTLLTAHLPRNDGDGRLQEAGQPRHFRPPRRRSSCTRPAYAAPVRRIATKVSYTGLNLFLYANNPEKSAEWYKALGFRQTMASDLPGGLKVFSLECGGVTVTLGPPAPFEPDHTQAWLRQKPWGTGAVLMPQVKDVDALHERAKEVGAEIVEPPMDQAWGARTVVLRDPDGYWLMFDQPVARARPKAAAGAKAAKAAKAKKAAAKGAGKKARKGKR